MYKYFLGFDNGISGTIGVVHADGSFCKFIKMPVFEEQDYTKAKKQIHRVDVAELKDFLANVIGVVGQDSAIAFLERPMINPVRFMATISAVRALEAVLIVLKDFRIPRHYIDSKEWQRVMLPQGTWKKVVTKKIKVLKSGEKVEVMKEVMKAESSDLKKASRDVARRMFPQAEIKDDGDGLLIAEFCRRRQLGQIK